MSNNVLTKFISGAKQLLLYKPPTAQDRFVLREAESQRPATAVAEAMREMRELLRFAHRLALILEQAKDILSSNPAPDKIKELSYQFKSLAMQKEELSPIRLAYENEEAITQRNVSASLAENLFFVQQIFRLPYNKDLVIRQIVIPTKPPLKAALVFSKGLVDKKEINSTVLQPLYTAKNIDALSGNILQTLTSQILPINQTTQARAFPAVIKAVQSGDSVLFVDGANEAIAVETKGYEHRAVNAPRIEQTVRGNQSAFTEKLLTNIALVRLNLRAPDLVSDMVTLGSRSQIDCAVMYIESVANPSLVSEVKRRLANISTDSITAGMLSEFIEDSPQIPFPQTLSTERPDRVSANLSEGRVALLLEGDPFAIIVPVSLFTLFQSPEDYAFRLPWGSMMRLLRYAAAIATLAVPSLYIAITYFHPEAMPTDLLNAISGTREKVPFPAIVEVLIMELSFEIIREASTRKPGLLGETIGIVGGIILGQAVVTANLASPITVVIVAITGVASFAIPDYPTGSAIRLVRFFFLLMAATLGLVGMASSLFLLIILLCSMKSFGVPYFSPIAPKTARGMDVVVRGFLYRHEMRPDELNTLDQRRQPSVSRKWDQQKAKGGKTDNG